MVQSNSRHNFENAALESLKLATNSAFGISLKSRSNHFVDLLLSVFLRLLLNFSKRALFFIILRQMTTILQDLVRILIKKLVKILVRILTTILLRSSCSRLAQPHLFEPALYLEADYKWKKSRTKK